MASTQVPAVVNAQDVISDPNSQQLSAETNNEKTLASSHHYLSSWKLGIVIASLCLGTFLIALDVNIIGVAVPKITTTFHSLDDVGWYGSAYLLTVTAFQPMMGFNYKYFSITTTYLVCVATFEGEARFYDDGSSNCWETLTCGCDWKWGP